MDKATEIKVTAIEGNGQYLDGGSMFGNAPRAVWSKWIKPDELGRIPLACRAMLVEAGDKKVLCETGIGVFFEPKLAERFGVQNYDHHRLLENLEDKGFSQEDIDYVILSHLHFDHAGGLLPHYRDLQAGRGELLFPKAHYVVGREAWARAENPHSRDRASFIPGLTEKLKTSGRLLIVEGDHLPGHLESVLKFHYSHGHTPGQMHACFQGADSSILYAGDLIPGTHWVHLPITMGYDRYPELLIDEKTELYEQAISNKWWIFYTHDSIVAASRIERDESGRFHPVEKKERLDQMSI